MIIEPITTPAAAITSPLPNKDQIRLREGLSGACFSPFVFFGRGCMAGRGIELHNMKAYPKQ